MRLYNTLTRELETFRPSHDDTVGMYVCGPTVYDHLHIGNVRPVIVFDTLRRYLETFHAWRVLYVQNVTDVDDKLISRSIESGRTVAEIASEYTQAYFDLLHRLGTLPPTASPKATENIDGMVELIGDLLDKGYAYVRDGDVYFRVDRVPEYGKLSGRTLAEQEAGARIESSEVKENPFDFTLWKAAKPGEPTWSAPWGNGRPGWHTECVVLSRKHLGTHLDIHAGGNDLVFPHHENEIAQAEASSDEPFFRFWVHNGMLSFGGEKMSKSLGNFRYAYEIVDEYGPETVRYFYLSRHYRKPLDFSEDGLRAAQTAVARIRTLIDDTLGELRDADGLPGEAGQAFSSSLDRFRSRYVAAMDDDLNTVGAIGVIQELVTEANRFRETAEGTDRFAMRAAVDLLREFGGPMGLFQANSTAPTGIEPELIELLIELRKNLREQKQFALADRIRDRMTELGITLKDTAQGTLWTA